LWNLTTFVALLDLPKLNLGRTLSSYPPRLRQSGGVADLLAMNAAPEPLVFVSYRRADSSAAARWIADSIRRTFGVTRVFIDTDSIRMGDAWPDRIDRALQSSTILLPVIGSSWLKIVDDFGRRRLDKPDDWVCAEIRHALRSGLPIIPLLLSNTRMPPREALPESIGNLARIQAFELRDSRWENDLSALFERLVELGFVRTSGETVRYPKPMVTLKDLTDAELKSALESLPHWKVSVSDIPGSEPNKRTELVRVFEFASFEDAIAFMGGATKRISELDHHPRWENIWRSVIVHLSTWDIGHKPSALDIELARYLEDVRSTFPPPKIGKLKG
jgi:pterin-4a-carbinolamine dehydratase